MNRFKLFKNIAGKSRKNIKIYNFLKESFSFKDFSCDFIFSFFKLSLSDILQMGQNA